MIEGGFRSNLTQAIDVVTVAHFVQGKASAWTVSVSPTTRFTSKRPRSTLGRTWSMTTRRRPSPGSGRVA
jgi:hypothetical protein